MTTNSLLALLQRQCPFGLYRIDIAIAIEESLTLCEQMRWQGFVVDGKNADNKENFLKAWADGLDFPHYFGYNWDAFEDCLLDLGWCDRKPRLVIYANPENLAHHDPKTWKTAQEILEVAIKYWQSRLTPLSILLVTQDISFQAIPLLAS
jgi:RNAse (barnase) inhibitor barstar